MLVQSLGTMQEKYKNITQITCPDGKNVYYNKYNEL